jgi:hypothetical protein
MTSSVVKTLLRSREPSVRFNVLTRVLGRERDADEVRRLQEQIRVSPRIKKILSERQADGRIPYHPYAKWYGAHWVLVVLADLDHPSGDESLIPLREQVYAWLFDKAHARGIQTIAGRVRRCASQEGNALYSLVKLGLADERTEELAQRLRDWQWPDGGWNCDKNPTARNSSFMESLIPLRALALHARVTGNEHSHRAAERAADVFLKRRLFKRQRDGALMNDDFIRLHYPCYWHYDILFGLKVMAETGWIGDKRCRDALEVLEGKQLPEGGYPAEGKYYRSTSGARSGRSLVDWGETSITRLNKFVTMDALFVLKVAGRLPRHFR